MSDAPDRAPRAKPDDFPRAMPQIDRRMLESLVCPLTHGRLDFDAGNAELVSLKAGLAYPIRDGIPIMLESEARRLEG